MAAVGERGPSRVALDQRPRMRDDLVFAELSQQGKAGVVLKEPGTGRMLRIGPSAFRYLKLLDGTRTVGEAMDHVAPAQGREGAAARAAMLSLTERLAAAQAFQGLEPAAPLPAVPAPWPTRIRDLALRFNPLRIRLPVIDPTPLLRRLDPLFPLFHPAAFALVPAVAGALTLLLSLGGRNPIDSFAAFRTFQGWLWIYPALLLTTFLHEMGHAIACRRNGGSVPRMGFLLNLLVFPGCYTDVSDSWLFPRGRRIAVSLAGVHVEAMLWCVAAGTWYGTRLFSPLNQGAFVFGTILTFRILSNLVPFLRLDGYFVVSDLLGIPNLRPKSFAYLAALLPVVGRRYREAAATAPGHRPILFIYGLLSLVSTGAALAYGGYWFHVWIAGWFAPGSQAPALVAAALFLLPVASALASFFVELERRRGSRTPAGSQP